MGLFFVFLVFFLVEPGFELRAFTSSHSTSWDYSREPLCLDLSWIPSLFFLSLPSPNPLSEPCAIQCSAWLTAALVATGWGWGEVGEQPPCCPPL
jgi:hypothetical protein